MENNLDFESLGNLVLSKNVYEMMDIIVKTSVKISGCARICFIAKEKKDFFIRAGIPENGHGIGEKVSLERGKEFLEEVMDKKIIRMVSARDSRLSYMKELIGKYGIFLVLFMPVYFKNRNIGILIIDAVEGRNDFNLKQIKEFLIFSSKVIGKELENNEKREKDLLKAKHDENLSALGKQTARIAHIFRNKLQTIGGFTENIMRKMEKMDIQGNVKLEKIKEAVGIIFKEKSELERFINDIMMFCKVSTCMEFEKSNINEFLKEMVIALNLGEKNIGVVWELEKHLNQTTVTFDQRYFGIVIHDIVRNAIEAGAKKILLKTMLHPERNLFRVIIGNDGENIERDDLEDIFSPFFTTKPGGTGLGLANVAKIIAAHNGEIEGRSGDNGHNGIKKGFGTLFEISMPLKR